MAIRSKMIGNIEKFLSKRHKGAQIEINTICEPYSDCFVVTYYEFGKDRGTLNVTVVIEGPKQTVAACRDSIYVNSL